MLPKLRVILLISLVLLPFQVMADAFQNILDGSLYYFPRAGGVAMNSAGDWVAIIDNALFLGKGVSQKKLFSLPMTKCRAGAVAVNRDGKWVAVLDNNLYSGFGESYRQVGEAIMPSLCHAAACSINDRGDFVAAIDDQIWSGNGNTAARIQKSNLGRVVSAASISINGKGEWIAVVDDDLFFGNGTVLEKIFDLGSPNGAQKGACAINEPGEWIAVIDRRQLHGTGMGCSDVGELPASAPVRCCGAGIDGAGNWVIVENDGIFAGRNDSPAVRVLDCHVRGLESASVAMNARGFWVATVDDDAVIGSGNQVLERVDFQLGEYAKATGASIDDSNGLLILIDDKVFLSEDNQLATIQNFRKVHREEP